MEDLTNSYYPHPLSNLSECRELTVIDPRETLAQWLVRNDLPPGGDFYITIDGVRVSAELLARTRVKSGHHIVVVNRLQGNSALRIIATIVLVVVGAIVGNAAGAAWGAEVGAAIGATAGSTTGALIVTGVVSGLITFAGGMLINSLLPIKPNALSSAAIGTGSPSYAISGGSNRLRLYEPVPFMYGTMLLTPDYAAVPFTDFAGEDQYLNSLFCFGMSDLIVEDIKIGDTPLSSYLAVQTQTTQYGTGANGITLFPGNIDTIGGGVLKLADGYMVRRSSTGTVRLVCDISGVSYYVGVNGDYGLWGTLILIEYRDVTGPADAWLPFLSTADAIPSGGFYTRGTYLNAVWYQVESRHSDPGVIEGPDDFFIVPETGQLTQLPTYWRFAPYSEGLTYTGPAEEAFTSTNQFYVVGSTTKPIRSSVGRDVPLGQYDVRMLLTNPEFVGTTPPLKISEWSWDTLKSVQPDNGNYNGMLRFAMRIRATSQISGTISQLNAVVRSKMVGRDEAGNWHYGTFSHGSRVQQGLNALEDSGNPAWCALDFLRGRLDQYGRPMYGCFVADEDIDFESIYAWALFCQSRNLECNLIYDGNESRLSVLQDIARTGRAIYYPATGRHAFVFDASDNPVVGIVNMANINRGSFSVEYATPALSDEIVVRFANREKNWEYDEARVQLNPGVIPMKTATLDIKGITSYAQAVREANLTLAEQVWLRRRVNWEQDIEGLMYGVGSVVRLSHDLTKWGHGGRLVNVSGQVIFLDEPVPATATPYLTLRSPDNTMYSLSVQAFTGDDRDYLTLVDPLPAAFNTTAPRDWLWMYDFQTPGQKLKIISVTPADEFTVKIVARDETPNYYNSADNGVTLPPPRGPFISDTPILSNLRITEQLYSVSGGGFEVELTATWDVIGEYDHAQVWVIYGEETFFTWLGQFRGAQISFRTVHTSGNAHLKILGQNALDLSGPGSLIEGNHVIQGLSLPPSDIETMNVQARRRDNLIVWSAVLDVDLRDYEVRYGPAGVTWESAASLGFINATSITSLPLRVGAENGHFDFLVKAYDSQGNSSVNAKRASLVVAIPARPSPNLAFVTNADLLVSWALSASTYDLAHYYVYYGGSFGEIDTRLPDVTTDALQVQQPVAFCGSLQVGLRAGDIAGNASVYGLNTIQNVPPVVTSTRADVIDNFALLYWSTRRGSIPVRTWKIWKEKNPTHGTLPGDPIPSSATYIGTNDTEFFTQFEKSSGLYRYYIQPVDFAGCAGGTNAVDATINQPPDFELFTDQYIDLSSPSASSNAYIDVDDGIDLVILPLNIVETWTEHFDGHGWATPQDQIDATYPLYAQPTLATGYVDYVVDIGVILAVSDISFTPSVALNSDIATVQYTISTKTALGDAWTDYPNTIAVLATNTRYVKFRVAAAVSDQHGMVTINSIYFSAGLRQKEETGSFTTNAGDVGGTVVLFTGSFYDIRSFNLDVVSPPGSRYDSVFNLVDTPNPLGFTAYAYNAVDGTRVTARMFYRVKGV